MPLRPLPSPYKVGIDICSVARIKNLLISEKHELGKAANAATLQTVPIRRSPWIAFKKLDQTCRTNMHLAAMNKHLNPHFMSKLFRPEEIEIFRENSYNRVAGTAAHAKLFHSIAGRWAAKEAIIKAASSAYRYEPGSNGKLSFHDIVIWPAGAGALNAAVVGKRRLTADGGSTHRVISDMAANQDDSKEKLDATHGTDLLHEAIYSIAQLDGDMVSLSISHENEFAVATALFI